MDVDEVMDDLYRRPPEQFIEGRDAYVVEARKAKDPAAASRIAALRKPSLAAWASNLLVHHARPEADRLRQLGQALREAHRTLNPQQMQELSHRQHQVIAALARQAADLAKQASHPLSESVRHEVEQLLHAVLVDPGFAEQWATGHLVKAPDTATVDFAALGTGASGRQPTAGKAPPPAGSAAKKATPAPSRAELRRRERIDRARTTARETHAEATRQEEELRHAEEAAHTSAARAAEASERAADLERQLHIARDMQRQAQQEADRHSARLREAARAAKEARRAAEAAEGELHRLDGTTPAPDR